MLIPLFFKVLNIFMMNFKDPYTAFKKWTVSMKVHKMKK